jgi:hypothetical protein
VKSHIELEQVPSFSNLSSLQTESNARSSPNPSPSPDPRHSNIVCYVLVFAHHAGSLILSGENTSQNWLWFLIDASRSKEQAEHRRYKTHLPISAFSSAANSVKVEGEPYIEGQRSSEKAANLQLLRLGVSVVKNVTAQPASLPEHVARTSSGVDCARQHLSTLLEEYVTIISIFRRVFLANYAIISSASATAQSRCIIHANLCFREG